MAKKAKIEPSFLKIKGLKVLDVRGYKPTVGKRVEPVFIFFDDKKTYIELEEQDPYDYHDCSYFARLIRIHQNEELWKEKFDFSVTITDDI